MPRKAKAKELELIDMLDGDAAILDKSTAPFVEMAITDKPTSRRKQTKTEQPKPPKRETANVKVVRESKDGTVGISFSGYGITVKTNKVYNAGDKITVSYTGEIGTPEFRVCLP